MKCTENILALIARANNLAWSYDNCEPDTKYHFRCNYDSRDIALWCMLNSESIESELKRYNQYLFEECF